MLKIKQKFSNFFSLYEFLIVLVNSLLATSIVFRVQLRNGLTLLNGDPYDAVIVTSLHEHWFNFFQGRESWNQVSYFYPYENTLGHTDGYLGSGILYSLLRILGIETFQATEITNFILHALIFSGFYIICKRLIKCSILYSLAGSWIFLLFNNYTLHAQRLQLSSIVFVLWIIIVLFSGLQDYKVKKLSGAYLKFSCVVILFGVLALTSFYIFWFFSFFGLLYVLVAAFQYLRVYGFQVSLIRPHIPILIITFLQIVLVLSPTAWMYLSKKQEVGSRSWEMVSKNTVRFWDYWQVGTENLFWGKRYQELIEFFDPNYAILGEYTSSGIELITFVLFLIASYSFIKKGHQHFDIKALIFPTFLGLFLIINLNGLTPWYIVFNIVPGAKTLNVVNIFLYILSVPIVLIITAFLNRVHIFSGIKLVIISIILCLQLNTGYQNLDVRKVERIVNLVPNPPNSCKSFVVGGIQDQGTFTQLPEWANNFYAHNIVGMYLGSKFSIPAINGIASYNPPDWNFSNPEDSDYISRVKNYMIFHKIASTCFFDFSTREWTRISSN